MRLLIAIGLVAMLGPVSWSGQSFAQGGVEPSAPASGVGKENAPKTAGEPAEAEGMMADVPEINRCILDVVRRMPSGGGYALHAGALKALRRAFIIEGKKWKIVPTQAVPSFCSGATYLVFLQVIQSLESQARIPWTAELTEVLRVKSQADGFGVWGRWNANGPGTAKLFFDGELGRNFNQLKEAKSGDFMKVFWSSAIGFQERGHSVIFLGVAGGESPELEFWSSNQGVGYGRKRVPLAKVGRMVFSRLERPENLVRVLALPEKDEYLAALLKRGSSEEEMNRRIGLVSGGSSPSDNR
jgi:hypothetical protein